MKNGIYRMPKCRPMLSRMAATRYMFFHTGRTSKLSFSDKEFIALNISTVTRIDKLIVVARCAMMFENISQPISGNSSEQLWKWVCVSVISTRIHQSNESKGTHELIEGDLRATLIEHEPPSVARDSGNANIRTHNEVSEEEPLAHERLTTIPWWYAHDAVIRWVEAQSGRWQTVRNKVDPEELDRNKSFRHAEENSQEDADDFTNI